jgi:hypothetical protein
MKSKGTTLLFAFVLLSVGALALMAQPKQNIPTGQQRPPGNLLTCPDIRVLSFKAALVSTQLGEPSVEFPHDTVRLEVILENVGGQAVPSAFIVDIIAYRNGQKIYGVGCPSALGAPGSRFVMDKIRDTFPHGVRTTYSVQVLPLYNECTTTNNQASFTIDEVQLHPGRKIQVPVQSRAPGAGGVPATAGRH